MEPPSGTMKKPTDAHDTMKKPADAHDTTKKPTDAPEGMRLCKKCAEFIPLDRFCTNPTAYRCKMHASLDFSLYRQKIMSNPTNKIALRLLSMFRMDRVRIFSKESTPAGEVNPGDILKLFETKRIQPSDQWRIVPIRPDDDWGVDNVDIVSKRVRKVLVATISKTSVDETQLYAKTFAMLSA
jgi:hypothetical protein